MFLANTFPSFFLSTIIVGPLTLVTVTKSFPQWFVNLFIVPVCLNKILSSGFNSVVTALGFAHHRFSFFLSVRGFVLLHHRALNSTVPGTMRNLSLTTLENRRKYGVSPVVQ